MFWLSHKPNRKRARRKVENRRVVKKGREPKKPLHILDVQAYSTRELQIKRSAQFRTIILCTGLFLSIVALVSTTRILLNKYIFDNPELKVTRLEVRSDGILSTQQIIKVAQVGKGLGILSLNLGEIRERLVQHPQIREVRIEREFPGTLRIAVEERFAIAWLRSEFPQVNPMSSGGILLDEDGVPFVCESLMREYTGLPVVGVSRLQELEPGKRLKNRQVLAALELLHTSRQALYDLNLEILAIHSPNPYSIVAEYNKGANVTFDLSDLSRQVANLRAATLYSQSINKSIASINLLMKRNIPVIYFDSTTPRMTRRSAPSSYQLPDPISVPVSRPSTAPRTLVASEESLAPVRREASQDRNNQIRSILGRN
ncbi:MAG: hypothetical protein ACI9R3_004088 [Verrucomicrobiales bacterium]|jgi:hypothetical protein